MTLKSLSQYGPHFQVKVLHSLLKNKKFLLNIRDVILPSFFENQAHQWIAKEAPLAKSVVVGDARASDLKIDLELPPF